MRKLRHAVVAIASAAMVLGTLGTAGASSTASSSSCVGRAQFVEDFALAAGISPVYPSTPDFTDVPPSSPYYGYIEAAAKDGFLSGTGGGLFDPSGCLTRAQIAKIEILALGDGSAATADATSSTAFKDDSSIPAWARGFIVEAASLGLVHGYPDGSFGPDATLTSTDEGYFLAQYKTVENALAFKVTASSSDVGVGGAVTLSTSGTNEPVTFTTTTGAVLSGSTFVGSTPGNYTVTAQTAEGLKATVAISVYGAATGLVIKAPSSVVANGLSTYTATVEVVDANGNVVASDNTDQITLMDQNDGVLAATSPISPATATTVVNGVAAFTLTSGTVPGATDQLTASGGTFANATAPLSSSLQVATSIGLTAPQYLSVNTQNVAASGGTFTAQVLDQTGNPMLQGSYGLTATLKGPATLDASSDTTTLGAYTGSGNPSSPATTTFDLYNEQGVTGAITETVSATGLTSGTGTTTAVIAGAAAKIALTAPANVSFVDDNGVSHITYGVQVEDANGYPVSGAHDLWATVLNSSGQQPGNIDVNGFGAQNPLLFSTGTDGSGTVNVAESVSTTGLPDAGTYTIQISDQNNILASSAVDTFQETASTPFQLAVTSTGYVAASDPKATISVQVEDTNRNPVPMAGITVDFTVTVGGTDVSVPASATTDASGVATVTATALPYTGLSYEIKATSSSLIPAYALFSVEPTVATSVTIQMQDTPVQPGGFAYDSSQQDLGSSSMATSSDQITFTVTVKDQYGNVLTNPGEQEVLNLTFQGTGSIANAAPGTAIVGPNLQGTWTVILPPGSGTGTFTAKANLAGPMTATITDTSVPNSPSGTAGIDIQPGNWDGWALYDTQGNRVGYTMEGFNQANGGPISGISFPPALTLAPLSVTANTPVEVVLKPIDDAGNPTLLTTTEGLFLDDNGRFGFAASNNGGAFRLSESGADLSQSAGTDWVTFPAGLPEMNVWYVNPLTNQYYLGGDAYST